MGEDVYDLLVVGGGINGVGIARDAAGRGLKVLLCEQKDLAWATSSASTKLIHGGLRYLEHFAFRLVRESLAEREILLQAAPHLVRPLRFVLPLAPGMRPAWMIRSGLFLYDHLSRRQILPSSRAIHLGGEPPELILTSPKNRGFCYSDCWVDDSRLVVLNAMDAAVRGAKILTQTTCVSARRKRNHWEIVLRPGHGGEHRIRSKALANVTGPWVRRFLADALETPSPAHARLVKGSHIVTPRLYRGNNAYLLQNTDGRVVFVIPYERRFSLVGTTDVEHPSDPAVETITAQEIDYLCQAVSRYFRSPIDQGRIVWSFSGLRPLFEDDQASTHKVTRDYRLVMDAGPGLPPLLTVYGGKLTTYRRLAQHAVSKLKGYFSPLGKPWTARSPLPGGDLGGLDLGSFAGDFQQRHPWLPPGLARRYAEAYGGLGEEVIAGARDKSGLGRHLGDGLYEAEVVYLREKEWASTARDILWRRSKLGLHVSGATVENLEMWLASN